MFEIGVRWGATLLAGANTPPRQLTQAPSSSDMGLGCFRPLVRELAQRGRGARRFSVCSHSCRGTVGHSPVSSGATDRHRFRTLAGREGLRTVNTAAGPRLDLGFSAGAVQFRVQRGAYESPCSSLPHGLAVTRAPRCDVQPAGRLDTLKVYGRGATQEGCWSQPGHVAVLLPGRELPRVHDLIPLTPQKRLTELMP